MTNSFVLDPAKLVSVEPDGANAAGVIAFRDYKGTVLQLDFTAYGETGKKLLNTKVGSKFTADGCIDIFKESDYLTVFSISSVSNIRTPDSSVEEQVPVTESVKTPVKAIAPSTVSIPPGAYQADYDDIPF